MDGQIDKLIRQAEQMDRKLNKSLPVWDYFCSSSSPPPLAVSAPWLPPSSVVATPGTRRYSLSPDIPSPVVPASSCLSLAVAVFWCALTPVFSPGVTSHKVNCS